MNRKLPTAWLDGRTDCRKAVDFFGYERTSEGKTARNPLLSFIPLGVASQDLVLRHRNALADQLEVVEVEARCHKPDGVLRPSDDMTPRIDDD